MIPEKQDYGFNCETEESIMGIVDLYKDHKEIRRVLDIGCYKGSWPYEYTPDWEIICLEPSFSSHIKSIFPDNCTLMETNYFDFVPKHEFDLIVCKYVLEHQSDDNARKMIEKIYHELSFGGFAYFSLPTGLSLSNTVYKAYFNIKKQEGLDSVTDGGHFTDYDIDNFVKELSSFGFEIEFSHIYKDEFSVYPYTHFAAMVDYYLGKGIDLRDNNMIVICRKPGK